MHVYRRRPGPTAQETRAIVVRSLRTRTIRGEKKNEL